MNSESVTINRAPVLTLWAAIVAERQGYDSKAALSLAKALTGLNAQSKGRRLGIFKPAETAEEKPAPKAGLGEEFWIKVLGRPVPAKQTPNGIRAVVKDQPVAPEAVERYLEQKFGEDLKAAREAMEYLARAFEPKKLAEIAYSLYERFRPRIPAGEAGWGAKGKLDLVLIRSLAKEA